AGLVVTSVACAGSAGLSVVAGAAIAAGARTALRAAPAIAPAPASMLTLIPASRARRNRRPPAPALPAADFTIGALRRLPGLARLREVDPADDVTVGVGLDGLEGQLGHPVGQGVGGHREVLVLAGSDGPARPGDLGDSGAERPVVGSDRLGQGHRGDGDRPA